MKTKILLVDDEVDLEALFRKRFRPQIRTGVYDFVFVRDGLEALRVLEQQPDIDLVLSDINMPGMDGLTLLARLSEINPLVRTVMVTAYGDMDNIRLAMNRGAFDFITKPINFQDLEATIEKTRQHVHQLREAAQLKAIDAMKTRFFTNITHELRTPLSLILSPVDKLLEIDDIPTPYQHQLTMVRRNARQLLQLINQLLDIHKLEARQMDLVNEVGDLPGFVGQIVDLFRPSAAIKNLTLTYQPELPTGTYLFDAGKWEKILNNLLSNAIKFTATGGISVELYPTPVGAGLSVQDTGIGIPADQLPYIFDRFYQVNLTRTEAYEGTGIGLALVRELALRLGGTIQVESRVGGHAPGTDFVLEVPIQRVRDSVEPTTIPAPGLLIDPEHPTNDLATPTSRSDQLPLILVVEDHRELREFMVAELATTYRIRVAGNGQEGWLVAREELPDVVITDLLMPKLDGFALIERLKADPATDHIAVILLTARDEQSSRMQGLACGADEYLTKPFHLDELQLRLRNLLARQQNLRDQFCQPWARPGEDLTSGAVLPTKAGQFLSRFYQLVESRLDDSALSVEDMADQLAMNRKTLYRKVHTLTQLSPLDLIRQYRLRKAVDLLKLGNNVSETAYLVGFESPSYFIRVFRDFYQQTPLEYLRQ
ncbi:hypothetical protein GCM10028803_61690 [Larkinella knui]|uniref:histidine kinase n=1 Tax=Larkinella knui TaxID=2025310 RepID=A0A3P1CB89_9BACT|nr:response regulator [Larkinella knui]RRB10500.1 response regulator [Larkinella knui]